MVDIPSPNVRSGPSIRAAIYTVIRQGTKVILLRQQSGWYRVELPNGAIGWVIRAGIGRRNGSNRRNQADLPVPTSTPSAPPTPVRTTVARHTPARRAPGRPVTVQAISWHSSSSRALTTRRTTASKAPRAKVALNVRAGTTLSNRIIGIVVPGGA